MSTAYISYAASGSVAVCCGLLLTLLVSPIATRPLLSTPRQFLGPGASAEDAEVEAEQAANMPKGAALTTGVLSSTIGEGEGEWAAGQSNANPRTPRNMRAESRDDSQLDLAHHGQYFSRTSTQTSGSLGSGDNGGRALFARV